MRLLDRLGNRRLSAAYRRVFGAPSAEVVLADLGDFCRARSAPFVTGDAIATGVLIGRQEVFHRIARYLNLTEEYLKEAGYTDGEINLVFEGEEDWTSL